MGDLVFLQEQFLCCTFDVGTEEFAHNSGDFLRVRGIDRDPDVDVGGRAGIAVIPDGVAADQQVFNLP